MAKKCPSCGSTNASGAAYCSACGKALKPVQASKSAQSGTKRKWAVPAIIVMAVMVLSAAYFWVFIADDIKADSISPAAEATALAGPGAQIYFAMTESNLRDKPTTTGSNILGKLPRGSQVTGTVQPASAGEAGWLELSDGNGFVALANLSPFKPPVLTKTLNDQNWVADGLIDVWTTTLPDSGLLDRIREGAKLTLIGITADDFVEVKLEEGRYGYIAGAEAILARLGGKPIAISFDPQTCAFGGEVGAQFTKIGTQLQMQWQALEAREFVDEAAREKAYAAAEGKSKYVRLRRSFEGLSLTGLGQHYESQSLYFDDSPAEVIEAFRAQGFNIDKNGLFSLTELYAGISATRGEGASYGKTELGCGV